MITDRATAVLLRDSDEGDMILVGKLLKGISNQDIAWMIIEKVQRADMIRVTMHAYWYDVFIISKVVTVMPDNTLKWGVTKA